MYGSPMAEASQKTTAATKRNNERNGYARVVSARRTSEGRDAVLAIFLGVALGAVRPPAFAGDEIL